MSKEMSAWVESLEKTAELAQNQKALQCIGAINCILYGNPGKFAKYTTVMDDPTGEYIGTITMPKDQNPYGSLQRRFGNMRIDEARTLGAWLLVT